jgi:hypothetical protein
VRVLDAPFDFDTRFLGRETTGVGIGTASQAGRQLCPYLQTIRRDGRRQVLRVGVEGEEFDPYV